MLANDGYGGLTATGLQLQSTSQIRMVSEDLFLSPERVRVKAVLSERACRGGARPDYFSFTTANTWHGPIATFRLTIDKGKPGNILFLCIDGIRKTGPTTFVVEKKDFKPTQDLRLLIVSGVSG